MTTTETNNHGGANAANGAQGTMAAAAAAAGIPPYMVNQPAGGPHGGTTPPPNQAYADAGMGSVVDQFAGLGIGRNFTFPGPRVINAPMVGQPYLGADNQYYLATGSGPIALGNALPPAAALIPNDASGFGKAIAWQPSMGMNPYNQYANQLPTNARPMISREQFPKNQDALVVAQYEVPALANRRSSYSTNESTPATPFYGSTASRDAGGHVTVFDRGSSAYTTPSPSQITSVGIVAQGKEFPAGQLPMDRDLEEILDRAPRIPEAVPAVFTPRENMKTLEQSLVNHIPGNRNVYIRGLHPTTDDSLLLQFAERFGRVETSKAIIDTATGACKGFGFAKFQTVRESEGCIRGFFARGYEVGFARVISLHPILARLGMRIMNALGILFLPASAEECHRRRFDQYIPDVKVVKRCDCTCDYHTNKYTDFDPFNQESFNSRLKAEGDEANTNLYISNLPKSISEAQLATIFDGYEIMSSKILRDSLGNSRGVGFARFETREICEQIMEEFTGTPIGEEGLPMQIRYSDTPQQKELKRITAERRQFRTNEYNVGAYGTPLVGMSPTIYGQPGWKQRGNSNGSTPVPRGPLAAPPKGGLSRLPSSNVVLGNKAASEDGSGDEGVTIHVDSPLVANGSTRSSPAKKEID